MPETAKDVQKKVLSIILKENDAEKAFEYVKTVVERIKKKIVDKESVLKGKKTQKFY